MIESSPALQRWDRGFIFDIKSAKRTADIGLPARYRERFCICRPLRGLLNSHGLLPSTEVLG